MEQERPEKTPASEDPQTAPMESAAESSDATAAAGVEDHPLGDTIRTLPEEPGVLIVNPEYGARLGDEEALRPTYERLGTYFKRRCPGWTCHLFSGNRALTPAIGLKASRKVPFFNADIECRLLRYEMWAGKAGAYGRQQVRQSAIHWRGGIQHHLWRSG